MRPTYPAAAMVRARELRSPGMDMSLRQVAAQIGKEYGTTPTSMTILRWTDPKWAEQDRQTTIERGRRYRRARGVRDRQTRQIATDADLLALRLEDGLSYPAIEKVVRRFFSSPMSEEQIRAKLHELGVEKNHAKARTTRSAA